MVAKKVTGDEPVNLNRGVVERVRANKKKTGIPISTFFEKAATEKLDRQDVYSSEKVGGKK